LTPSRPSNADPFGANKPLHNAKVLDLSNVATGSRRYKKDPLNSDLFFQAHKRPERHEKQMRNIEKERAQHEKVQLDRLLEELKGPDWLRIMGISGITESEKKLYEPKRVLFVREITAMIEKFKQWKEEEKRRKIEREQALLAEEEEIKEESEVEEVQEEEIEEEIEDEEEGQDSPSVSPGADPPPSVNDLDALAARQLLQEADSATNQSKKPFGTLPPLPPKPTPYRPFTSFYSKKHLRDAAVAGHRRSRTLTAFGEPVPEMEDQDFELPDSILNEEAIKACGRRKRRERRTSPA
jgi:Something about silencing, SAS, complex subunit 4